MAIEIYKNSKIFVACPAGVATGGPENLHQLVNLLRQKMHINAYMYYYPLNKLVDPVNKNYKQYNNPYVTAVEDKQENILIVPEVYSGISLLKSYNNIRKIVYWLSVDNFYYWSSVVNFYLSGKFLLDQPVSIKMIKDITNYSLRGIRYNLVKDKYLKDVSYHLAQSHYAINHLAKKGIPKDKIFYLSDYINDAFLNAKIDSSIKKDLVAYNPVKGYKFTRKIINHAKDINFTSIKGLNRTGVIEKLKSTKVYIDFGNHPGKDRIPREAAILGNCIITNRSGAANYYADISIPDEYKFEEKSENINLIIKKINECISQYKDKNKDFKEYRKIIKSSKSQFLKDARAIFKKI